MSARWGGAFTPALVYFTLQFMSWRQAFMLYGAIGVVWALFFYRWYRDNPRDNPSASIAAELRLRSGSGNTWPGHGDALGRSLPVAQVWLLCAQYFCLSYGWYFYITWLPTYLEQGRHLETWTGARWLGSAAILGRLAIAAFCRIPTIGAVDRRRGAHAQAHGLHGLHRRQLIAAAFQPC